MFLLGVAPAVHVPFWVLHQQCMFLLDLNNWVMHPVARVSIKYWKTSVRNTVFSDYLEYIFCVYELPEDGRQTGPKHVV
jgi:hypothetical protein